MIRTAVNRTGNQSGDSATLRNVPDGAQASGDRYDIVS